MDTYPVLPREVRNAKAAILACICGILGCLAFIPILVILLGRPWSSPIALVTLPLALLPLLGIALGLLGLAHIRAGGGVLRGRGLALAGLFGGLAWTAFSVIGMLIAAWYLPQLQEETLRQNEDNALDSLRGIARAEEIFDMDDKDRNRANDYWTGDVAGLYRYCPDRIELGLAQADALPLPTSRVATGSPAPYRGYLFVILKSDEKGIPYQRDEDADGKSVTNLSRYAFCAYPARYGETGKRTFLIGEQGPIYAKDLGTTGSSTPPNQWPKEPTKEGWTLERREKSSSKQEQR